VVYPRLRMKISRSDDATRTLLTTRTLGNFPCEQSLDTVAVQTRSRAATSVNVSKSSGSRRVVNFVETGVGEGER
jgi:hypothetical protein